MFWFLVVLATVVATGVVAFVGNLIRISRRGYVVATYNLLFRKIYDEVLLETGLPSAALREAFKVFGSCPLIKKLTTDEIETVNAVVGLANDPKEIINRLVMDLSTDKTLNALRNKKFLGSVVQRFGGFRQSQPHVGKTASTGVPRPLAQVPPHLHERAEDFIDSARSLMGVHRPRFQRDYGEIFMNAKTPPGSFELLATIAFAFCASLRVKRDVPESLQSSIQSAIEDALAEWYSDAQMFYESLRRFVADNMKPDQGVNMQAGKECALAAHWVITTLTDLPDVNDIRTKEMRAHLVASLATVFLTELDGFLSETDGYWTTP